MTVEANPLPLPLRSTAAFPVNLQGRPSDPTCQLRQQTLVAVTRARKQRALQRPCNDDVITTW
jgi:hypothetical protein